MRILVILTGSQLSNPKSGAENRVYNLIKEPIKKDNKILVLEPNPHNRNDEIPEEIREGIEKRYCFKGWSICGRTFPVITDIKLSFLISLLKILKKEKIDIIQIAHPYGIALAKFAVKLLQKRIPIVYDAHNVYSYLIYHSLLNDPKRKYLEKVIVRSYVPTIEKIAVKCADHIITVSHEDKTCFVEKYRLSGEKIAVIPSGVNIVGLKTMKDKYYVRKDLDIKTNKIVAVFHGTYHYFPNKNAIDHIIDFIAPKLINKDMLFLIAGLNVPVFEKDNVKSVGFVEDVYSLIHSADIAIVPIIHGGGTRLKILDYMGVGLSIVSTKKGIEGINAKNGEHAIIVDDVNEEFINAIKYLIDNEEERKRIGANARRLAEEEYDWDKIGEKLDKLYREILEEKKHANK